MCVAVLVLTGVRWNAKGGRVDVCSTEFVYIECLSSVKPFVAVTNKNKGGWRGGIV